VSVAVLVPEGELVVALTGVLLVVAIVAGVVVAGIVVTWVVVAWVVVLRVSTVTATVIVRPSAEQISQTKEPDPDLVLSRSLSPPPATVAASTSSEQSEEASVGAVSLRLSPPPPAGIVVGATGELAKNGPTDQAGPYSEDTAVNQLIPSADKPCIRGRLVSRAA